jgi:hypothetical protein
LKEYEIHPEQYLFPLIQKWPTLSHSGETVLVRREGDEVVMINQLRQSSLPPLTQRFAITAHSLVPAVHAVLGDKDTMESGAMYQDGKIWDDGVKLVKTLDASLQKGLWDISEELLKANPHWVTKP